MVLSHLIIVSLETTDCPTGVSKDAAWVTYQITFPSEFTFPSFLCTPPATNSRLVTLENDNVTVVYFVILLMLQKLAKVFDIFICARLLSQGFSTGLLCLPRPGMRPVAQKCMQLCWATGVSMEVTNRLQAGHSSKTAQNVSQLLQLTAGQSFCG